MGLPLALKIKEVVPIRDAASVIKFSRSKIKKEAKIRTEEEAHRASSPLGKSELAETVREGIDGRLARMKAHMLLFCGKVDQVALQHQGGDPPGVFLRNIRMAAVNQRPQSDHALFGLAVIVGGKCGGN